MKKIHIALAVLALAALASCQQENELNIEPLAKGEVGFYLRGARETKSGSQVAATFKGETFELGTNEKGVSYVLEETITDLNSIAPETKGTPAYTENVIALYGGKFSATVIGSGNSLIEKGGEFVYDGSKFMYYRKYDGNMWKKAPLTFYMWMPGALNNAVTGGVNGLTCANGTIAFDYDGSKLTTADQMQDLIFSARTFAGLASDENTGEEYYDEEKGADVLFHHALTGVKFAVNPSSANGVTITNVTINGLKDKGHCVITPRKEDKTGYKDNSTEDYSSGDGTTVVWSSLAKASPAVSYSLGDNYDGTTVNYAEGAGHFGTDPDNKYPATFSAGGSNVNNLNDSEATYTFWFIPQAIEADVTLTITYTEGSDTTPHNWDVPIGTYLKAKNVIWKAGEIRTYVLKIDDVNVTITDQFTASEKNSVNIKNTGNTKAFIRAAIIGQWVDNYGHPVFGYTNYKNGLPEPKEIASWYEDQFVKNVTNAEREFGYFTGLAGYGTTASPNNNWVKGSDGYYYYTLPVESNANTASLFTSFTVYTNKAPKMFVGGQEVSTTLLIEIATQAISAVNSDGTDAYKNSDGTTYNYLKAWADAKSVASSSQQVTP